MIIFLIVALTARILTAPEQPIAPEETALEHYRAGVAAVPPGAANEGHQRRQAARSSAGSPGLAPWVLMEALGTLSIDFLQGLPQQLANAGSPGREIDHAGLNFI